MTDCSCLEGLAREDLKGMEPYDAYYAPGIIRLDANENPHDFPTEVSRFINSQIGPQFYGRYPDPLARELIADLSGYFGSGPENIMVGNGSDELILNIMLAFGSGKKVFIASPTFSMYAIHARVAGAVPVNVPRGPNFEIDVQTVLKAAGGDPGIVVLCSPNNPTGNAADIRDIEAIAGSVKSLVVVDEAYVEFGGESCLPLLDRYPNLLVMRTFSKAFGLAGMRVGYLLAHREIVRELLRIKQPFNVNSFSQLAARSVLKYRELFEDRIKAIIKDREYLVKRMESIPGLRLYPSVTNFICFKTAAPALEVYRGLLKDGVMIRYIKTPEGEELLRVTVGTARENNIFTDRLQLLLGD
ncbi:MAG: histidinol-phosphate transaminase [Firmicutes bacterium]|nr:histidinol-phosphate transaminase [Bacillota bacterium]